MAVSQLERRMLAVLAADVAGHARLMERDEPGTIARLEEVRSRLTDPLLAQHHGRVVKLMGDGAIVVFDSVVDAVSQVAAAAACIGGRAGPDPCGRRLVRPP